MHYLDIVLLEYFLYLRHLGLYFNYQNSIICFNKQYMAKERKQSNELSFIKSSSALKITSEHFLALKENISSFDFSELFMYQKILAKYFIEIIKKWHQIPEQSEKLKKTSELINYLYTKLESFHGKARLESLKQHRYLHFLINQYREKSKKQLQPIKMIRKEKVSGDEKKTLKKIISEYTFEKAERKMVNLSTLQSSIQLLCQSQRMPLTNPQNLIEKNQLFFENLKITHSNLLEHALVYLDSEQFKEKFQQKLIQYIVAGLNFQKLVVILIGFDPKSLVPKPKSFTPEERKVYETKFQEIINSQIGSSPLKYHNLWKHVSIHFIEVLKNPFQRAMTKKEQFVVLIKFIPLSKPSTFFCMKSKEVAILIENDIILNKQSKSPFKMIKKGEILYEYFRNFQMERKQSKKKYKYQNMQFNDPILQKYKRNQIKSYFQSIPQISTDDLFDQNITVNENGFNFEKIVIVSSNDEKKLTKFILQLKRELRQLFSSEFKIWKVQYSPKYLINYRFEQNVMKELKIQFDQGDQFQFRYLQQIQHVKQRAFVGK